MLPVSGAEQLKTSEAQNTRPMISASGAYSRLVRRVPGSSSRSARQEQVPQALGPGAALSGSIIDGGQMPASTSRCQAADRGTT